jgi:sensor domain CHASE-containing protein
MNISAKMSVVIAAIFAGTIGVVFGALSVWILRTEREKEE